MHRTPISTLASIFLLGVVANDFCADVALAQSYTIPGLGSGTFPPYTVNDNTVDFSTEGGRFTTITSGNYSGLWFGNGDPGLATYTFHFQQPVTQVDLTFDAMSSSGGQSEYLDAFLSRPADVTLSISSLDLAYTNISATTFNGSRVTVTADWPNFTEAGKARLVASAGEQPFSQLSFSHNGVSAGSVFERVVIEQPSYIVLREKAEAAGSEGFWAGTNDEIPGFDHVGFAHKGLVYESNVAIGGTFYDAYLEKTVSVPAVNGVKRVHNVGSFAWNSGSEGSTSTTDLTFYKVNPSLANSMAAVMDANAGATFNLLDLSTLEGIKQTLSPAAQKGRDNSFTCVGLIEFAAEQAGHNGGQGFIPNLLETIPGTGFSMLSPELLDWSLAASANIQNVRDAIQGFFDPVDFLITDPLGRQFGYTDAGGFADEIPGFNYSGNGGVEQFLIIDPLVGDYRIEFIGLGETFRGGFGTTIKGWEFEEMLGNGETKIVTFSVVPEPSSIALLAGMAIIAACRLLMPNPSKM